MTDATTPVYTYTIDVLNPVATGTGTSSMTISSWKVQGAYLNLQDDLYVITDAAGNAVAAVHRFGALVTRDDVTQYVTPTIAP